jgi:preprotein translocase subunit SecA
VAEVEEVHATGRPVLAGTRSVATSEHLAALLEARGLPYVLLNARHDQQEASVVAEAGRPGRITIATNMAGRGTDIRLPASVVAAGGLHVIATEPHASGRIDRQLFGRAGRQGEPGTASLFASLDDEVVVRFTSAAARAVARAGFAGHLPGASGLAYALVRHAQRRSEAHAYRQRKSVLRQDNWLDESLGFRRGAL